MRKSLIVLLLNAPFIFMQAQDALIPDGSGNIPRTINDIIAEAQENKYEAFFEQDFEHHTGLPKRYTSLYHDNEPMWDADWNYPGWRDGDHRWPSWYDQNIFDSIVVDDETGSVVMKFNFKDTIVQGWSGVAPYRCGDYWKVNLEGEYKEMYLSYNVKFRPGFVWNQGGKLPATNGGSPLNKATQENCVRPQYGEGYSTAVMFKPEGGLAWYLFYQEQANDQWGETVYWDDFQPEGLNFLENGRLSLDVTEERWYNITIRVVINSFIGDTPNKDGIMEGFIDGKLVSQISGLYLLTPPDKNKGVNQISLGHFFGGNENYQGPQRDEWTLFDDFICFRYADGLDVPRGNELSPPGRVLDLPNLKTEMEQPPVLDTIPPSIPEGLGTDRITGSFIIISWEPSSDNTLVGGYHVFLDGIQLATTEEPSYRIEDLEPNTKYTIEVNAIDTAFNESDRSQALIVSTIQLDTIPPAIPTGLRATDSTENSINITWESASDDVSLEGYIVYVDEKKIGTALSNVFSILGLQASTIYNIKIKSYDSSLNESPFSGGIDIQTRAPDLEPPTVPDGLLATLVTQNSISLIWNTSQDNVGVTGYAVYMNDIQKGISLTNSYTITELASGVDYRISVTAHDHVFNESARSEEIVAKTKNPDQVITPASLPEVEILDFSYSPAVEITQSLSEIKSFGHTDMVDYGLMVSEENGDPEGESAIIYYANLEFSDVLHTQRIDDGLQIMYDFSEGQGITVHDKSGSGSAVDLVIENPLVTTWLPGQGLKVRSSTIISSQEEPTQLMNAIVATNEVTMEAWIRTSAVDQAGPARIMTLSADNFNRIATLGQEGNKASYNYKVRLTTTNTTENGFPEITTNTDFLSLSLHHIVYTRDSQGLEKIYVNGVEIITGQREGTISADTGNYLAIANELTGERPWKGVYYMVAIYNRALEENEVIQNYNAGTGEIQYTTTLSVEPNNTYLVTPFARTEQGISYGRTEVLIPENVIYTSETDTLYIAPYPNPSNGDFKLHIAFDYQDKPAYFRVADIMGHVLYNEELTLTELMGYEYIPEGQSVSGDIDVSLSKHLDSGIYLFMFIIGDIKTATRLMIQH